MRALSTVETIGKDVLFTLRTFRRHPAFVLLTMLSLGLGIGANTAVFSVVSGAFLRTLSVADVETLRFVERRSSTQSGSDTIAYPLYQSLREQNQTMQGLAAFNGTQHGRTVNPDKTPGRVSRQFVSGNFFEVLGVRSIQGRAFTEADNRTDGEYSVAVLSHRYWSSWFGGNTSVVGQRITIDDRVYTIIGVTEPGFTGVESGRATDVWLPAVAMGECATDPGCQVYRLVGRARPGVGDEQASANLTTIFRPFLETQARTIGITDEAQLRRYVSQRLVLTPGAGGNMRFVEGIRTPLFLLMALVVIILLIACANVGSLLLARTLERRREIAVRLSIGAGRGRLIRQLLTESLLLAVLGGVLGLLFANWASQALVRLLPQGGGDLVLDFRLDAKVLLFTFAVAVISTMLFGLGPALQSTRHDLIAAVKEGAVAGGGRTGGRRLRAAFVVAQIALSVVLLIGAGLFARSLRNLRLMDVGYDPAQILSFETHTPSAWTDEQIIVERDRLLDRVRALPGVAAVSVAGPAPLGGNKWGSSIKVSGFVAQSSEDSRVSFFSVSSDFFDTVRTSLLAGRVFERSDRLGAPLVAVVNEAFARKFGEGRNVVGITFEKEAGAPIQIIGVVRDANFLDLRVQTSMPVAFFSADQRPGPGEAIMVRGASDPSGLVQPLRKALTDAASPGVRFDTPITMQQHINDLLLPENTIAQLWSGFALLALALVCFGFYGIMTQVAGRRTTEIGIRMALGASRASVLWMVLREALTLIGLGLVLGLPGSVLSGRVIATLLFGLSPTDPLTIAGATLLLIFTTVLAAALPAWRAARLNPVIALRNE